MQYIWTWWQSVTYNWTGLMQQWFGAKPRWKNPPADYIRETRRLDKTMVTDSKPVVWPNEYRDLKLNVGPVRQVPYQGSVGGHPVQLGTDPMARTIRVQNWYGGDRYIDGDFYYSYKPGQSYHVKVPGPIRYGWAVQGYPNGLNQGDRHLYILEADGTAHEMIGFWQTDWTCVHYRKYDPDGNMVDGIPDAKGAPHKGNIQWTSLAWDVGDEPHRLGMSFYQLGNFPDGVGDSPPPYDAWDTPSYGKLYRLSREEYERQISLGPDEEQRNFLDSLRFYGAVPFDRGGAGWSANVAFISGSQQAESTVGELDIPISALEEVTS